jgi:hypothetical protein
MLGRAAVSRGVNWPERRQNNAALEAGAWPKATFFIE